MQDIEQITGKITGLTRLESSINGNPRYLVTLRTPEGDLINARTKPDSMAAYGIQTGQHVWAEIGWHYGKVAIQNIFTKPWTDGSITESDLK